MNKKVTEQQINNLFNNHVQEIRRLIKGNDKSCYMFTVVMPAIDMYINAIHGALHASNTLTFFIMLRCACEAISAIAYFEINDPSNKYYNLYLDKGRVYAYNTEYKKDAPVSIRSQMQCVDELKAAKGFKKNYDFLCKNTHFGPMHFLTMLHEPKTINNKYIQIKWMIGPKGTQNRYSEKSLTAITDLFPTMMRVLKHCVDSLTENTSRSHYTIDEGKSLIPKEFQELFKEILACREVNK